MLEQKSPSAHDAADSASQTMTQLEGIRQKVFMDRYSLKDAHGNPLEFYPEQLWTRVAKGIAAIEQTEEKRAEWEKLFYDALADFKFVPGGRILAGAGTGHQVTFYNCFVIPSPEDSRQGILDNLKVMTEIMARGGGVGINLSTLRPRGSYIKTVNGTASGPCSWAQLYSVATGDVIQQGGCFGPAERIATNKGLIPARELADRLDSGETIEAQTHKGLRPFTSVFRNGTKDLFEVTTIRGYRVRVTLDHKMGVMRNGELVTIPLRDLAEGDEVLLHVGESIKGNASYIQLATTEQQKTVISQPTHLTPDLAYVVGYIYGDSSAKQGQKKTATTNNILSLTITDAHAQIKERLVLSLQELFGSTPVVEEDETATSRLSIDEEIVTWLQEKQLLPAQVEHLHIPESIFRSPAAAMSAFIAGYFDANGYEHGQNGSYRIDNGSREMLQDMQLLLLSNGIVSQMTQPYNSQPDLATMYRLTITGDLFTERFNQFICNCNSHGFDQHTFRPGYHNHSITYPLAVWKPAKADERYASYDVQVEATRDHVSHYAMARVRDRVQAAGGVALVERLDALLGVQPDTIASIVALGPSEVFDFEVDDVHMLSGGGLYTSNSRRGALMLMLDDTHPDIEEFITVKRTAGKIEHANLSVCISDAFMQAVKDDAEWKLIWQGEVKKTIRARALWDLICKSAWESAEPGMVFMDRYNKESNTWYYEDIRCVNPCGEQGLPPFGVCNLGALNLSAFVKNGKMDWENWHVRSKIAMRFLDNVVDCDRILYRRKPARHKWGHGAPVWARWDWPMR